MSEKTSFVIDSGLTNEENYNQFVKFLSTAKPSINDLLDMYNDYSILFRMFKDEEYEFMTEAIVAAIPNQKIK